MKSLLHRYHCFAGREASRAMAKFSFDEAELSRWDIDDLGPFERSALDDWFDKYKYLKCYPIVGKVSEPPRDLKMTIEDLEKYNGCQAVPQGRVDAPIYVGINGKIIDVSYGGKDMYAIGCPYHIFAGKDASRALAKMSFKEEDLSSRKLDDLNDQETKTLLDWEKKFVEVKKYPIVGFIVNERLNIT